MVSLKSSVALMGASVFMLGTSCCSSDKADALLIQKSEVEQFYKAFDQADTAQRAKDLKAYVSNSKNPGISRIYEMNIPSEDHFAASVQSKVKYYKSMRKHIFEMVNLKFPKLNEYYLKFKKVYPKAHQPKVIFTVGMLNIGGTISDEGLIIATEWYAKKTQGTMMEGVDVSALDSTYVAYLFDRNAFEDLTFHELMHYEQLKNKGGLEASLNQTTLLGVVLNEGSADFVSDMITGGAFNKARANYIYGNKNEKALWEKFQKDIKSTDRKVALDWLYNFSRTDITPDLGYFMGAKICESYYKNAIKNEKNPAQAIEEILNITDAKGFLTQSGYADKTK